MYIALKLWVRYKPDPHNTVGITIFLYIYEGAYVHGRQIYNLFVPALDTNRKASRWRAFLSCFAAICIVSILQCPRPHQTTAKLSKKNRNKSRSNRFDGALCEISAYCYRFLTLAQHESGTRKNYILVSDRI